MINPNDVADAAASKLVTNKVSLGITDAASIAEDTDAKDLRPPYCGVFANFENESIQESADSTQIGVPVEIKVLCSSSENKTAHLSFAEAFILANKVVTLLKGLLTVGSDEVVLMLRKRPFEILRNAADQSVVQVNFYYELKAVGE